MGLSIHYNGSFNKKASLSNMIEEVKDVAKIYGWKYHIYEETFNKQTTAEKQQNIDLYGISFTPPNSETISLTFLSNGKLCCGAVLQLLGSDIKSNPYLYSLSVKTQFAGSVVHKIIIQLLKYLSNKYFKEFELTDEGQYWETGDEKLLNSIFKTYDDLIDSVQFSIESVPIKKGETFEEYFKRILKQKNKK